jgi:hypothetical protein
MEGHDVVVLEVDLDEGLPVDGVLVDAGAVIVVAGEVEVALQRGAREIDRDIAAAVEQQPVPVLERRLREVEAGVPREVRCAEQLARRVVRPAVQRADDVLRARRGPSA